MEEVKDIETLVNEEVEETNEKDRSKVLAFVPKIPLGFSTGISFELPFNKNFNYKNILVVGNLRGIFGEFTYYSKKENGKPDWEFNPNTERYNEEGRANLYWLRRCLENGAHVTFIERLEDHWFLTENQSYFDIVKECVVECMINDNIKYTQFIHAKAITGPDSKFNLDDYINKNMKFDVCIMNAPYANGLHEKFEVAGIDLVTDEIVWIGPISWLLGKKQKKELTERCNRYYTNIKLIENNWDYFDGNIQNKLGTVYVNKKKEKKIIYNNKEYTKCEEITTFSHDPILVSIFNKIGCDKLVDNIHEHVYHVPNRNGKGFQNRPLWNNSNVYFCRVPGVRSVHLNSEETGEMWSMFGKKIAYENNCGKWNKAINFKDKTGKLAEYGIPVKTEEECKNFWKYAHTTFVSLCLFFIKQYSALSNGELKYVPWLDFKQEWDDLKLFKYFGLTKEEVEHVYKCVPYYYGKSSEEYVLKNY